MADTAAPATPKKRGPMGPKPTKPQHPPTLEMVEKAIIAEKDRKGTSVLAIKKYITAHYKVTPSHLKHMLRRAFEAGLKSGKLIRPKGQTDSGLLSGRYRLASGKPVKPAAAVKKAKSPAKKAKSPAKKAKSPAKKPAAKKAPKKKTPKKAAKK